MPHPCFDRLRDQLQPGRFKLLHAGPWFWPRDDQGEAYTFAQTRANMPSHLPGEVPLLTVNASGKPAMWLLVGDRRQDNLQPFQPGAQQAWQRAIAAVPRSAPILWNHTQVRAASDLRAIWVGGSNAPTLDGDSFGVAFALAALSKAIERPIPVEFIASATLDSKGNLGKVEGLEQKISVCATYAPRVQKFIVAKNQLAEAEDIACSHPGLQIIGCETLTHVLEAVFPDLEKDLITLADKDAVAENIFRLAVGRRDKVVYWAPIAKAASAALTSWEPISEDVTQKLKLAAAIGLRHEDNQGTLQMPPRHWIDGLPQPIRLDVVAHIVQNAADCGAPSPEDAQKLAESFLEGNRGSHAFPEHLRILGAYARLKYVTGNASEALAHQLEAIEGWLERWEYDEVSYPLSAAVVYAGAIRDKSAFQRLSEFDEEWRFRAGARPEGDAYVQAARARAEVQLGRLEEAAKRIAWFEKRNGQLPDHLRDGGLFWLSRALSSDPKHAERVRAQISSGSTTSIIQNLYSRVDVEENLRLLMSKQYIARKMSENLGPCTPQKLADYLVENFPY